MNKSSILAATIAIARGITLKAETKDILDDLENIGNDILDFSLGLGEDMIDLTINTGEALIDPNTYINIGEDLVDFTVDTANWLVDPDSYVELGNGIWDGTIDTINWMGDGDNWEAAGKTIGYSSLMLITGKPEDAWNMVSNDKLYLGETWDAIDDAKDAEAEARRQYNEYVKNVEEYNTVTLPGAKVSAQQYCEKYSDMFGYEQEVGKWYGSRRNTYNATYQLSGYLSTGDEIYDMYETMFGDSFTVEECDDADCLHPCYGAEQGNNHCNTCFLIGFGKLQNGEEFAFTEQEQKVCDACSIPPVEAQPLETLTFEEWIEKMKAASASASQ